MSKSKVQLYYKGVTEEAIGPEQGITKRQFDDLAGQIKPHLATLKDEITGGRTSYGKLLDDESNIQRVREVIAGMEKGCEILVVLGIGGSGLGNIALQTALNPYLYNLDDRQRTGPRVFVFDNIDPAQLSSFLQWADDKLDRTIFNVISKSGWTLETAAQFMIVRQLLLDRIGKDGYSRQVVATTDADKGILRKIADEEGLKTLPVPEGVGGRFSVLSAVGLFSAAMCGIDIDSLLAGARDMDERVGNMDFYKNPAAIIAAIHYHYYGRGKRISVMMPYSYHLKDLADWYRQLWAESLGKARDLQGNRVNTGPTPVKALGATDQHSQVQLYREGPNDKVFTFLQVRDFGESIAIGPAPDCVGELDFLAGRDLGTLLNNEKRATEYALIESKRPCLTVLFDEVNAYSIGQFIYLYEVTTSLAGALFGINPYDQPGVELGKQATYALMGRPGPENEGWAKEIELLTEIDEDFLV